jgi:opacity protein-like surface antigen
MKQPMLRILSFFVLNLYLPASAFSQADTVKVKTRDYLSIALTYTNGKILPTNPFVEGENLSGKPLLYHQSVSAKLLWQNPGYTEWQRIYHIPYYGIGYSKADFNTRELGSPNSVFGVLGVPVLRLNKLELYSEFQFGVAWNWNKYDSITNPKNIAIGGGMTVHLNIGFNAFYPLSRHLDLGAGVAFSHFSNGGFERPNRGLNLFSPSIELKYHPVGKPDVRNAPRAGKLPKRHEFYLMMGYGDHQMVEHELDTNYYAVGGLSAFYLMQHTNAFKSGPGLDFNYWWSLTARENGSPGPVGWDNLTIGAFYQIEFALNRLSLHGGVGNYLRHRNYGNCEQFYQRVGVKYHFTDHISMGVNVRSINFMLAEFLEFHLGYHFLRDH